MKGKNRSRSARYFVAGDRRGAGDELRGLKKVRSEGSRCQAKERGPAQWQNRAPKGVRAVPWQKTPRNVDMLLPGSLQPLDKLGQLAEGSTQSLAGEPHGSYGTLAPQHTNRGLSGFRLSYTSRLALPPF